MCVHLCCPPVSGMRVPGSQKLVANGCCGYPPPGQPTHPQKPGQMRETSLLKSKSQKDGDICLLWLVLSHGRIPVTWNQHSVGTHVLVEFDTCSQGSHPLGERVTGTPTCSLWMGSQPALWHPRPDVSQGALHWESSTLPCVSPQDTYFWGRLLLSISGRTLGTGPSEALLRTHGAGRCYLTDCRHRETPIPADDGVKCLWAQEAEAGSPSPWTVRRPGADPQGDLGGRSAPPRLCPLSC